MYKSDLILVKIILTKMVSIYWVLFEIHLDLKKEYFIKNGQGLLECVICLKDDELFMDIVQRKYQDIVKHKKSCGTKSKVIGIKEERAFGIDYGV